MEEEPLGVLETRRVSVIRKAWGGHLGKEKRNIIFAQSRQACDRELLNDTHLRAFTAGAGL